MGGKVIGRAGAMINQLEREAPGASIKIKQGSTCYIFGAPKSVAKIKDQVDEIVAKHNETIARTQQEEKVLAGCSWAAAAPPPAQATSGAPVAASSDWGGFQLAQVQGW